MKEDKIKQSIQTAFENIQHPLTKENLIKSHLLKSIDVQNGSVVVTLQNTFDRKIQIQLESQIRTWLATQNITIENLRIKFPKPDETTKTPSKSVSSPSENQYPIPTKKNIKGIKKIIGIASGKGGVGKSTVSMNLAQALAHQNKSIGLLDTDIYGPSVGKLINQFGRQDLEVKNNKIIPFNKYNMKVMSFSFLLEEKQAVIWRGPMLAKTIEQFLFDVDWGDLDYLILDLPPGTGDVPLSISQFINLDGVFIVTTPQEIAKIDVERSIQMFQELKIPTLGILENMSHFTCQNCNHTTHIFGQNAGEQISKEFNIPLITKIPLSPLLIKSGDMGVPIFEENKEWDTINSDVNELKNIFFEISNKIQKLL